VDLPWKKLWRGLGVDLPWIFLFYGFVSWFCKWRGFGVDLPWKFLRAFSMVKPNVSAGIFSRQIHAKLTPLFFTTVHSMCACLFTPLCEASFMSWGIVDVVDNAMRARAPEIHTKQLHVSLTPRHLVWSCSAEFICS
jgi:hypothetical protein